MYTLLLLLVTSTFSDIQRGDDNWFKNEFSVINKGRLYNTLIYLENLDIAECVLECIRFLNCVTVNYHSESKICELADDDFDWYEADVDSPGWYNYGTPPRVNGGFSEWIQHSPCSPTCGNDRHEIQTRSCTNPEPKHGGIDCVGKRRRVLSCSSKPCPIDGGLSEWTQMDPCSSTCGSSGQQMQKRTCTNPEPKYGGKDCVGDEEHRTRVVSCPHKPCPINGGFTEWIANGSCSADPCRQTLIRECTNPRPKNGGADCAGNTIRTVQCDKHCQMIACENSELKLSCTDGKNIKISSASYGRTHKTTCKNHRNTDCRASTSKSVMQEICDDKVSCSVKASNAIFRDPCGNVPKYLNVSFICN